MLNNKLISTKLKKANVINVQKMNFCNFEKNV